MEFISLASGSSGNCYYFEIKGVSFLVDAGVGPRILKKRLADYEKDPEKIDFMLITHNHIDHIKHLGSISARNSIPVYSTDLVHKSIIRTPFVDKGYLSYKRELIKNVPEEILGIKVTCFNVPHDTDESLGFFIETEHCNLTILTDLGFVGEEAINYCKNSHHVIIESNYDSSMLSGGGYPSYLKDRIKGANGHLCNYDTAQAIKNFYHPELRNIFLCHLSINNNTPDLAIEESQRALNDCGANHPDNKINLYCLPRREHRLFIL